MTCNFYLKSLVCKSNKLIVKVVLLIGCCVATTQLAIATTEQVNKITSQSKQYFNQLSDAALALYNPRVRYISGYQKITYPNGDVSADSGVCSDVVIRAYRAIGIDLQQKLHLDIKQNFNSYPSKRIWGLKSPDTNIDHRRVPNLETFFARKGIKKIISNNPTDYLPGDIVSWRLPNNLPHIGIVVNKKSADGKRFMLMHNIGAGQVYEDVLFSWQIVGHYLYK